ncbi:uncharacterized protein LOC119264920 [Pygocentrus nattereri]|uniref:uncharacterized protein LOC119264920 n=1 Tax=Pygocentrus nattereri TaxID=42514 RepID=UPI0018912900|nr:uncharacterized protein LOC119264920 [Pygocentrus nattereri]
MITVFATFCLFVTVKTSETDELQVQTVKCGENVTIKCHPDFIKGKEHVLAWYKQSSGKLPELIVRTSDNNANVRVADTFKQRFRLTAGEEKFELSIIKTVEEDAGTYLCVKTKQSVIEFGSGTLLLFPDEKSEKRNLTEVDVKSGESVTLQCSVAALSCSGEHSVYWIRHGSGDSHPGIIYTHGDTDSPCTRSSETDSPTQSCVYKLPKRKLSLSDAGTYYCAVAACGQMLFGSGTKLNVKGECLQQMSILFWLSIVRTGLLAGMIIILIVVHIVQKSAVELLIPQLVNLRALSSPGDPPSSFNTACSTMHWAPSGFIFTSWLPLKPRVAFSRSI